MKTAEKILWAVLLIPYVYVATIWKNLPQKLPMHFTADGRVDRMGNKTELLFVLLMMSATALLSYYAVTYAYKLDPKKGASMNKDKIRKLGLAIAFFVVLVMYFVIYSITRGSVKMGVRYIFAGIGLLYAIVGNYMHTIKPNYFVGIRVPWTLNDPENWRRTHLLAGKWWFFGGLVLVIACLISPSSMANTLLLSITCLLCIVPAIYSYLLFRRGKHSENEN